MSSSKGEKRVPISRQVQDDMVEYGAYSALSRHIPHVIDGLKPVHRRTIWQCANSDAKEKLTKVMSISGLVARIHPHGGAGDSISKMVQGFPFTSNYPLLSGKGTFGSEIVPQGIASERYVEARLSPFARDVLVENLPISPMMATFDGRETEPVFIESKLPLVLLNQTVGIAVGFTVGIPGHSLREVVSCMEKELLGESYEWPEPYWSGWRGEHFWVLDPISGAKRLYTNWGLKRLGANKWLIEGAPHDRDIDKVKERLSELEADKDSPLASFEDNSKRSYDITLTFKRGQTPETEKEVAAIIGSPASFRISYTVLWTDGTIKEATPKEILKEFIRHRVTVKKRELERVRDAKVGELQKVSELLRFIRDGWPGKAAKCPSRKSLVKDLVSANFTSAEWLSELAIYRTTQDEVEKLLAREKLLNKDIAETEKKINSPKAISTLLQDEWKTLLNTHGEKTVERRVNHGCIYPSLAAFRESAGKVAGVNSLSQSAKKNRNAGQTGGAGEKDGVNGASDSDGDAAKSGIVLSSFERIPAVKVVSASKSKSKPK